MSMNTEEFTIKLNKELIGLSCGDVATKLKISYLTLNRWSLGISAPHPLGRDAVFVTLEEMKNE